jgi:hypothetical protein
VFGGSSVTLKEDKYCWTHNHEKKRCTVGSEHGLVPDEQFVSKTRALNSDVAEEIALGLRVVVAAAATTAVVLTAVRR